MPLHLRAIVFLAAFLAVPAIADVRFPPRPAEGTFLCDEADLLAPADEQALRDIAARLLEKRGVPLIVVTIESQSDYNAGHLAIEDYARRLFDEWGIGSPDHNYGILLLVAVRDRRARIELGAEWSNDHSRVCQDIMDRLIVPAFKRNDYADGIMDGARGLAAMADGRKVDYPKRSLGDWFRENFQPQLYEKWLTIFVAIVTFAVYRVGRFFGIKFGDGNRDYGGSGGRRGWGGGSFGGGFSGGGGASGSW